MESNDRDALKELACELAKEIREPTGLTLEWRAGGNGDEALLIDAHCCLVI
jgi:hypothetical protein